MNLLRTTICCFFTLFTGVFLFAQTSGKVLVLVHVVNEQQSSLPDCTVELWKGASLVKIQMTDSSGQVQFTSLPGTYLCRISRVGYSGFTTLSFSVANSDVQLPTVVLQSTSTSLEEVTVSARKPFIELQPGRTMVNVEAGISNTGSTVLELLEKLPGVTVDKDGNISLKGKSQVMLLIDNKPTYLSGTELATLLSGMNASQLSQVELMTNPSARYEASGNAGIINLKTRRSDQKGFNGSATTTYTQGRYPKNNNNLSLNYRAGKWSFFTNYSNSFVQNYLDLYADRTYYLDDGVTVKSYLEQPSFIKFNSTVHSVRGGLDYALSSRTTLGLMATGFFLNRTEAGNNIGIWKSAGKVVDSMIATNSSNKTNFNNAGLNLNYRHSFTQNQELSFDVDYLDYSLGNEQYFENLLPNQNTEAIKGNLPTSIRIYSAKADYESTHGPVKWATGWKTSRINTDNTADYYYKSGSMNWLPDFNRTNHFLYNEYIHALYGNLQAKLEKWTLQGGLRFEATNYDADQLGNLMRKDSAFTRDYHSLFPTANVNYELDSLNSFSFSAGRRIDRPAFQKLNPFTLIINKYTYQTGNPYFLPQYTWNFELSHLYKNTLITTLSYCRTNDYFSQIFYANNGIITYTQGNLGLLQVLGASVSAQVAPLRWWSFSGQVVYNHRVMEGQILKGQFVQTLNRSVNQANFSLNNQFKFGRSWTAELMGNYNTRSRQDIQELVEPSGQLSAGIGKSLWQNKASLKLAVRDIFYTQAMIGFTEFQNSTEYFSLRRDTRVATLSFTYRFGKAFKSTTKRSGGSAAEETQRVGTGN